MFSTPGPVQTLARLAIQSKRYQDDMDFRDAVDAVLNAPVYDAAPALLEALERLVYADQPASCCSAGEAARVAIAQAKGTA